ncbi:hypothetical protein [Ascidiimonas sp. W6]|uniref:hypothetical protein n=1 Tax=Ascidiimonas meishanensis TaxID=3128903 RepID=UPI0030EE46B1
MKKILLLLLFVLLSPNIKAQDTSTIEDRYASYFELPRESIFLHLNKSTFIKGESIWFKGYVYDRKQGVPFKETTNIYVGLYNKEGKQLSKYLVKATDGYAAGTIKIDSTYATGAYFLKANTNWMRNFNEDDAFVQRIQLINEEKANSPAMESTYDLQLLPEGGHLVDQVPGVVGVKLVNSEGRGVSFDQGVLINKLGTKITDFKANAFGMASFSFTPDINESYQVLVTLKDGEKINAAIPNIKEKGVVLKVVNTPGTKEVLISIATNKATYKNIKQKPFHLLIHKDGASKSSPFVFNQSEKEIILPLKEDFLFKGINTITLFDENENPIAERMIFNHYNWKPTNAAISINEIKGDSITLDLQFMSDLNSEKNISVSVLPSETRAYNQKISTFSEFLLKPYVKGHIENPAHYFKESTRRKAYDLDLLLLTQGWSRYEWNSIFNRKPNPVFEFENGLTLKGVFNHPKLDKFPAFFIDASRYHESRVQDLKNPNFEIPNMYFETDEKVEIQLVKRNGKLKTHSLYARTLSNLSTDQLNTTHFNTPLLFTEPLPDLTYDFQDEKIVFLEEIDLVGKTKEKEKRYNNYIYRKNDVTVDLETANKLPFVTDIIRRKGFDVNDDTPGTVTIFSRRRSSLGNQQPPIVYFDDTRLAGGFDILWQLRSTEIERIVVEPIGISEGSRGAGGVIRIWSRKGSIFGDVEKQRQKVFIDNSISYLPVKEFYAPKYLYSSPLFRYFGVIHWEPKVTTDEKGKATIRVLNTGVRELNLYIEGMSKNGELISTMKTVRIDKSASK